VAALAGAALAAVVPVAGPSPSAGAATTPFTGPEPIVFVHGWNDDSSSFDTMLGRFEADGFPSDRLFAFDYDDEASTATVTAPLLDEYVQDVLAETGAPEVDIVAYSMGSLSSRWCIAFGGCADVVDDWVSLGGPNHGTLWSNFCAIITPVGCGDMAQSSPVVTALNAGDETPGDLVSWSTFRTTCDAVIVPSESTELAGATNTVLPGCLSHDDHVLDAGEYALVHNTVEDVEVPTAPQDLGGEPGDGQVTLTWLPPANDGGSPVTGYQVFEGGTEAADLVAEVDAPVDGSAEVSDTIPGLVNGDTYLWYVRAENVAGHGPFSNSASVSPEAATPSAPRDLGGTAGDEQVTLTWDPPLTGAPITGYQVFEGGTEAADLVAEVDAPLDGSAEVSDTIPGLVNGDTYLWYVRAENAAGHGAFSNSVTLTPHFVPPGTPSFTDVPATHLFYEDVEWAAHEGIAAGFGDGTYRPGRPVTRQAMAAFLHRLAGAPPVSLPTSPSFSDVGVSHPFFDEVEWVAGEGIAEGYPDGRFRPAGTITRQAMAAFLYRLAAADEDVPPTAPFTDVSTSHPFATEVAWVAEHDVADGYDDGTYRPGAVVTRQAMAAFLHRFADAHLLP
jgi:hypothetical protein